MQIFSSSYVFRTPSFAHICALLAFIRWIEITYDESFLIKPLIPRASINSNNIVPNIYNFSKFWLVTTYFIFDDRYIVVRLFDETRWVGRRTTNIWHFSEYQMRRIGFTYLSPPPRNILSFNICSPYVSSGIKTVKEVWPKVCNLQSFLFTQAHKNCAIWLTRWDRSSTESFFDTVHLYANFKAGNYHII